MTNLTQNFHPIPHFTDPPENTSLSNAAISVEEGKIPPRIVCSSRAYPEPAFYWTRNGETIVKGSALVVNSVLGRDDAGVYTCVAFNKHGNHSTDAVIDIHCEFSKGKGVVSGGREMLYFFYKRTRGVFCVRGTLSLTVHYRWKRAMLS